MIIAAVDIGSNACRMLICDAHTYKDGTVDFTKLNLLRIPLRLGFDVFRFGKISAEKRQMILDSMIAYKQLYKIYKVQDWVVCATSAMRDASNSRDIVLSVKEETGIEINVITGAEEASVLYESHIQQYASDEGVSMYIDVGGGSTELTLFKNNKLIQKRSFNIGTIRMLTDKVLDDEWDALKAYAKDIQKNYNKIKVIGTGGNINKVFSLSKVKEGRPLNLELIRDYYRELAATTLEDRMHLYGMREDRADVIVPALQIYSSTMKWSGAEEIYVPKIGLADGLVRNLYNKRIQSVH